MKVFLTRFGETATSGPWSSHIISLRDDCPGENRAQKLRSRRVSAVPPIRHGELTADVCPPSALKPHTSSY